MASEPIIKPFFNNKCILVHFATGHIAIRELQIDDVNR